MAGKAGAGAAAAAAQVQAQPQVDLDAIRREAREKLLAEQRAEREAEAKRREDEVKQREEDVKRQAEEVIQQQILAIREEELQAAKAAQERERARAIQALREKAGLGGDGSGVKRDRISFLDSPRSQAEEEEVLRERKPKRSLQERLLEAASSSSGGGGVLTAEEMETMFRQKVTNATDLQPSRSAEMRRLAFAAWAGAHMYALEREENPSLRCEAMEFTLRMLEACFVQLSIFSSDTSGKDLPTKIARLEAALVGVATEGGQVLGTKARAWLAVPGAGLGGARSSAYGERKASNYAAKEAAASAATTQGAAMSQTMMAQMLQMMQKAGNESVAAAATTTSPAPSSLDQAIITYLTNAHKPAAASPVAATLPAGNQQFRPRPAPSSQMCYRCSEMGHIASFCPNAAKMAAAAAAATAQAVSERGQRNGKRQTRTGNTTPRTAPMAQPPGPSHIEATRALVERESPAQPPGPLRQRAAAEAPPDFIESDGGGRVRAEAPPGGGPMSEREEEGGQKEDKILARDIAANGPCPVALPFSAFPPPALPVNRSSEDPIPPLPQAEAAAPSSPARPYEFLPPPPPPPRPCSCGVCGECTGDIDLMAKEAKVVLEGPAQIQKEKAERIAAQQQLMFVQLEQSGSRPPPSEEHTQMNPLYLRLQEQNYEERKEEGRSTGESGWELAAEDGEEEEEERKHEQKDENSTAHDPPYSKLPLREIMRAGKKVFDKWEEGRSCTFCKRKGHRRATCMVSPPPDEPAIPEPNPTPLQLAKRAFVLGLIRRGPSPMGPRAHTGKEHWAPGEKWRATERALEAGTLANKGNPWEPSRKRRDKLRRCLGYWWAIGADATVLGWIGFGVRLQFEVQPERLAFRNHRSYDLEKDHIDQEHETHVKDGSFLISKGYHVHVSNPLQVEVNAKGKRRMCVDMRYTNSHTADYSFTQETLGRHVAALIQKGALMITTDVEKAYYQVPLHKDSQMFCGWQHKGQWVTPTIIVFGFSAAPFVFTKIMRVPLNLMRALLISGSNCIDDNLWAEMRKWMEEAKHIVLTTFTTLGWTFNDKCSFEPSTTVIYNGMWIDSKKFEIRATDEKIEAARKLAWSLWYTISDGRPVQLKDLQRLTGRLQSMKLALEGVAEWTRGLYADIAATLERCEQRPSKYETTLLREAAIGDINFWAFRLGKQNGLPIRDTGSEVHVIMNSDAGDLGWGAHLNNRAGLQVHGDLPPETTGASSTEREIIGVLLATKHFAEQLQRQRVRFVLDSYCACRNLINGGGPVGRLNELVKEWWVLCRVLRITPLYQWVPREENTLADELSKEAAASLELTDRAIEHIRNWLVECDEPGIDPCIWRQTTIHVPVFNKIGLRLQEMRRARRPGCIVVPTWPGPATRELHTYSSHRLRLGEMSKLLHENAQHAIAHASWEMEAHLIIPERKESKAKDQA